MQLTLNSIAEPYSELVGFQTISMNPVALSNLPNEPPATLVDETMEPLAVPNDPDAPMPIAVELDEPPEYPPRELTAALNRSICSGCHVHDGRYAT